MSLVSRDKLLIWHPFTQEKTASLPIPIQSGQGSYLIDEAGNRYLDLISSWWVNLHGHSHPKLCDAIYDQAKQLEHVIFAGFTHEPAVLLCEKLNTILPQSLTKFFFSDNGSTAVEVALKMAHQYWFNKGETNRRLYLSFDGGYHGDTFGAMSVGKKSNFHDPFQNLLFDIISIPFPETWDNDEAVEQKEADALAMLSKQLDAHGKHISAMIFEPIVQGAAGMRMCRPEFIRQVVKLVKAYDIFVIYDEIMTGFGRLGTYFAAEQVGIDPDFICISKGITGGFLPLSLTVTKQAVYDAFLDDEWDKAFAHGHSYTANPIACRVALASFGLLVKDSTQKAIKDIHRAHKNGLQRLNQTCPDVVKNSRCVGTIAAFEVNSDECLNHYLKKAFLQHGLLLRPLNNTVYLLPPYSVTIQEIDHAYLTIIAILQQASAEGLIKTYVT